MNVIFFARITLGVSARSFSTVNLLLVFNAQPTGTVISRRYALQSLLIIKDKTWLVKRIFFFIQIKWQRLKKKITHTHIQQQHCTAITLIKLLR